MTDEQILSAQQILSGIDKTESESPDGWWETSVGAEFGSKKLKEIFELMGDLVMTNKPMLSVERELIEFALGFKCNGHKNRTDQAYDMQTAKDKLRALLDKPVEAIPDKTVDAFSAWYSKNHYEDMSRATVGLMAFKAGAAYAESAAQHQGEPVAYRVMFNDGEKSKWENGKPQSQDLYDVRDGVISGVERAYAEQPAPVAVAIPEERTRRTSDIRDEAYDNVFNDALAEVARLNGVKP